MHVLIVKHKAIIVIIEAIKRLFTPFGIIKSELSIIS